MRKSKAAAIYVELDQEEVDILEAQIKLSQHTKTTIIRSLIRTFAPGSHWQQLRAIAIAEGLKDEGDAVQMLIDLYNQADLNEVVWAGRSKTVAMGVVTYERD
jgi:hypothetical protein